MKNKHNLWPTLTQAKKIKRQKKEEKQIINILVNQQGWEATPLNLGEYNEK